MRRIVLTVMLLVAFLAPALASAKLPYFGLEVAPLRPDVGERITFTMTCYDDAAHSELSSSCFGSGDHMVWVHPLDTEGELDRSDWIPVAGHTTSNGVDRGHITIDEPGAYDVLPLWRTWEPRQGGEFPSVIRIEVGADTPIVRIVAAAIGIVGVFLAARSWRRRTATPPVTP
jgi:hypothetical protein